MKYKEAMEIGIECGLCCPEEYIANIEIHATSLFDYKDIAKEEAELKADAIASGIDYDTIMPAHYALLNAKLNKAIKGDNDAP